MQIGRKPAVMILVAIMAGIGAGAVCHAQLEPSTLKTLVQDFGLVTQAFLRLIAMIIAPLVLASLAGGLARMSGPEIGRIGAKVFVVLLAASLLSLSIGMVTAIVLHPGSGLHLQDAVITGAKLPAQELTLADFLMRIIPTSIVDAMARNQVLQIVLFSLLSGVALSAMGEAARPVRDLAQAVLGMMLKIADYVMVLAPVAVFASFTAVIAANGLGVLTTFVTLIASFYLGLLVLWLFLAAAAFLVLRERAPRLFRLMRQPAILAFSTTSSEAAYAGTLEALESFGVPPKLSGVILPLGYSFNLTGSMMYATFAVVFLAQAYGVAMTVGDYVQLAGLLLVMSKGIASVPRAALVVVTAVLPFFHLPVSAVALLFGVDQIMDMGRTGTNVVGNAIVAAGLAEMEKRASRRRTVALAATQMPY